MGLDLYAGTLTRYYSHNWKTVVQQWAEGNGYTFNRITPDGEPAGNEEELSPAEIQAAVENWRDQILGAISQPGQNTYGTGKTGRGIRSIFRRQTRKSGRKGLVSDCQSLKAAQGKRRSGAGVSIQAVP